MKPFSVETGAFAAILALAAAGCQGQEPQGRQTLLTKPATPPVSMTAVALDSPSLETRTLKYWQSHFAENQKAARAAGIWTTLAEVKESPRKGVNGAASLANLGPYTFVSSASWPTEYRKGGEKKAQAMQDLAAFRPIYLKVIKASQADHFHWPPQKFKNFDQMGQAQRMARSAVGAAIIDAERGKPQNLVPAFAAMDRISRGLLDSGYRQGLFWGQQLREQSARELAVLAREDKISEKLIRQAAAHLQPVKVSIPQAVRYELCYPIPTYKSLYKIDATGASRELAAELQAYKMASPKEVATAIRSVSYAFWAKSWPKLKKGSGQLDNPMIFAETEDWPLGIDAYGHCASSVSEIYSPAGLATALAAIEVSLYARKHGKPPASLSAIKASHDPMTCQFLNYQVKGSEFVIWSSGDDAINDQGTKDDISISSKSLGVPG